MLKRLVAKLIRVTPRSVAAEINSVISRCPTPRPRSPSTTAIASTGIPHSSMGLSSSPTNVRIHAAPTGPQPRSAITATSPSRGKSLQKREFLGSLTHSSNGGQSSPGRLAAWYSICCMNPRSPGSAGRTISSGSPTHRVFHSRMYGCSRLSDSPRDVHGTPSLEPPHRLGGPEARGAPRCRRRSPTRQPALPRAGPNNGSGQALAGWLPDTAPAERSVSPSPPWGRRTRSSTRDASPTRCFLTRAGRSFGLARGPWRRPAQPRRRQPLGRPQDRPVRPDGVTKPFRCGVPDSGRLTFTGEPPLQRPP